MARDQSRRTCLIILYAASGAASHLWAKATSQGGYSKKTIEYCAGADQDDKKAEALR